MNRRGFLATLATVAVAPFAPAAATPGLAFHPAAFALAMRPLTLAEQYSIDFDWHSYDVAMAQHQPAPGGFLRYVKASAEAEGRVS